MSEPAALRMGPREWGTLLVLSFLWGGSFFFYKVLVTALPPLTVVLGRVALAAVALNLVLLVTRGGRPRARLPWEPTLLLGLLSNAIPFSLIAFGETRVDSGVASILNAMTPVFTVLAAHALTTNEKLTAAKVAGVLCGFIGVVVLVGPSALATGSGPLLLGEAACLSATVVYAFAALYGRRLRHLPPLQVAAGQVTASTALLLPVALVVDRPWQLAWPTTPVWAAWIGLALLSTALAYVLYYRILAVAGATNLVLVTFLVPVSALVLGVLFLGETVAVQALGGMVLIGAGLALMDGRLWRMAVTARGSVRAARP